MTDLIKNDFSPIENGRGRPVSLQTAVLITLKYLALNTYQQTIVETFKLSQSTVSRCITAVMEKLMDKVLQFIYFWKTAVERRHSQKKFSEIAGFPSVVGCVDGMHIRILRPRVDESQYLYRKGYHSINIQAICDHRGKFFHVSAKWLVSTNDSFILRNLPAHFNALEGGARS